MHLSTEEPAASWLFELFGEVGGDVPEYFLLGFFFLSINDALKSYCKQLVLKT